jgi:hypothetical protein
LVHFRCTGYRATIFSPTTPYRESGRLIVGIDRSRVEAIHDDVLSRSQAGRVRSIGRARLFRRHPCADRRQARNRHPIRTLRFGSHNARRPRRYAMLIALREVVITGGYQRLSLRCPNPISIPTYRVRHYNRDIETRSQKSVIHVGQRIIVHFGLRLLQNRLSNDRLYSAFAVPNQKRRV